MTGSGVSKDNMRPLTPPQGQRGNTWLPSDIISLQEGNIALEQRDDQVGVHNKVHRQNTQRTPGTHFFDEWQGGNGGKAYNEYDGSSYKTGLSQGSAWIN